MKLLKKILSINKSSNYKQILPKKKVSVCILFYQDKTKVDVKNFLDKNNINEVINVRMLCDIINSNLYINTINLSDYNHTEINGFQLPINIINNKKNGESEEFYKNKDYSYNLYYIDSNRYDSLVKKIVIINSNGKFILISKDEYLKLEKKLSKETLTEITYVKEHEEKSDGKTKIGGYNSLFHFVKFFIKNGKILFAGQKEDYKKHETLYFNKSENKPLSLFDDIVAIVRYSVISFKLNIYRDSSVWSEHILNKIPDGVTVIDEDLNILYSNEQRRKRHKNNILGKKCNVVFNGDKCSKCEYKNLIDNKTFSMHSGERNILKIYDKADNVYWLLENIITAHVKSYTKHIGILACKDINVRQEISMLIENIQNIAKLDNIFKRIEETFIQKIGFSNIRILLNFGNPVVTKKTSCQKESPEFVLMFANNPIQKEHVGMIFPCKIFSNNINGNFYPNCYERLNICSSEDLKEFPDLKSIFLDKLNMPNKWLDIPLWNGNHLVGIIGVDFNNDYYKWGFVNRNFKNILYNNSKLIAIGLNNFFMKRSSKLFRELSHEINITKKDLNFEKRICQIIKQKLISLDNFAYTNLTVLYYKNENTRIRLVACSDNIEFSSKTVYPSQNNYQLLNNSSYFYPILDEEILNRSNDVIFLNENIGKINSLIDVKIEAKGKLIGILRLIKKEESLPLSFFSYNLLQKLKEQLSSIFYNFYLKNSFRQIIATTTELSTPVKTTVHNYISKAFQKLTEIYPDSALTLLLVDNNKLKLYEYYIKDIKHNNIVLEYQLPPFNIKKNNLRIEWLKENKIGFSPTLLYRNNDYWVFNNREELLTELNKIYEKGTDTKFDSVFPVLKRYESEFVRKIIHNNKVIGLIRFQDTQKDMYKDDEDFEQLTNILSVQFGHTITLINEIQHLEDYKEALIHETRAPVGVARNIFGKMDKYINLKIDEHFSNKNNNPVVIKNKDQFYVYLRRLRNEIEFIYSLVITQQIDDFNIIKLNVKYGNLRNVIIDSINTLRHRYNSKLSNYKINIIDKKVDFCKIYLEDNFLKIAFYNIIYNALKYSDRKLEEDVHVIGECTNDKYILTITNFGIVIKENETERIFEKKVRGSNSKNIAGLGLGLYFTKKVLAMFGASVKMIPNQHLNKTDVIVTFDLSENRKKLENSIFSQNKNNLL